MKAQIEENGTLSVLRPAHRHVGRMKPQRCYLFKATLCGDDCPMFRESPHAADTPEGKEISLLTLACHSVKFKGVKDLRKED